MNKQEMTEAFLHALRAFAAEQKQERAARKEARKQIKEPTIPRLAQQALAILADNDGMTEEQWRAAMREQMGLSYHAGRVIWHRYKDRILTDGWVRKDDDGRFYIVPKGEKERPKSVA
jgi:hypothetical protein